MFAGGIGIQEIVIILIVGLLVFGAARLPKIARSLGQGIKEFKKTVKGLDVDDEESENKVKYVQNPPPNYGAQQYPQGPQYGAGPQTQPGTQYPPYSGSPQDQGQTAQNQWNAGQQAPNQSPPGTTSQPPPGTSQPPPGTTSQPPPGTSQQNEGEKKA
jgi:sec-independent protein translocase protein TatA